eukprot:8554475-Pyramimonas_sp.AAC.1
MIVRWEDRRVPLLYRRLRSGERPQAVKPPSKFDLKELPAQSQTQGCQGRTHKAKKNRHHGAHVHQALPAVMAQARDAHPHGKIHAPLPTAVIGAFLFCVREARAICARGRILRDPGQA